MAHRPILQILFLFLCSVLLVADGLAVMQLIPPIQEVQVPRGRTGTFVFTISNNGDEDSPSRFSIHDMDMGQDGVPFIADSGSARGCSGWITLQPTDTVIKAHESLVLTGTVKVPSSAEGGYYALVKGAFMETTIPLSGEQVNIKGSQINLESQAVVAVLLTVPSSRSKPVIVPDTLLLFPRGADSTSISFGARQKKGWKVVIPIRNDGNIHTRLGGTVSFWAENGTRLESGALQAGRGYVLPGKTRDFTAEGENILVDGYYMIRVALRTEEGNTMSQSFPFAVYNGQVRPGAVTDQLKDLLHTASPGFALREPFLTRTVTPGGSSYQAISVTNTVNDTITLIPRLSEWALDPVGTPQLSTNDSLQPRSGTAWVHFMQDTLRVAPGQGGLLKLKIDTPNEAVGEYYAAVVFERDRVHYDVSPEFLAGRTQLLALTSPTGVQESIEIDSVIVVRESSKERDLTLHRFRFLVWNTGNTHCFVKGSLALEKQIAPETYDRATTSIDFGGMETYILPGGSRGFEVNVPDIAAGTYRLVVSANFKTETPAVVRYQRMKLS